jgi:hypothetical protein
VSGGSRSKARAGAPRERAALSIVLVHGVGHRKAGDTLQAWIVGLREGLEVSLPSPWSVSACSPPRQDGVVRLTVADGQGREREIVVREAHWASTYVLPRRRVVAAWLVMAAPLLLYLTLGVDGRDRQGSIVGIAARFFLRLFVGAVLLRAVVSFLGAPLAGLAAVGLLVALFASRQRNMVGHVRAAALEKSEREAVIGHIHAAIAAAQSEARKVMVIAHSQGGFLAYRALESQRVASLVGVGSGLVPIGLLEQCLHVRVAAVLWLTAAASTLGLVWVASSVAISSPAEAKPGIFMFVAGGAATLDGRVPTAPNDLPGLTDFLPHAVFGAAFWLSAACLVALLLAARRFGLPEFAGPGECRARRWTEVSTAQDSVGRLAPLLLPDRVGRHRVVVAGNPLLDHVGYFRRAALVPRLIGTEITELLGLKPAGRWPLRIQELAVRAERRHRARLALVLGAAGLLLLPGALAGQTIGGALAPFVAQLALVVLVAAVAVAFGDRRDVRRASKAPLPATDDPPGDAASRPWAATGLLLVAQANASCAAVLAARTSPPAAGLHPLIALASVVAAAYCWAGYRARRQWMVPLVVVAPIFVAAHYSSLESLVPAEVAVRSATVIALSAVGLWIGVRSSFKRAWRARDGLRRRVRRA